MNIPQSDILTTNHTEDINRLKLGLLQPLFLLWKKILNENQRNQTWKGELI